MSEQNLTTIPFVGQSPPLLVTGVGQVDQIVTKSSEIAPLVDIEVLEADYLRACLDEYYSLDADEAAGISIPELSKNQIRLPSGLVIDVPALAGDWQGPFLPENDDTFPSEFFCHHLLSKLDNV